MPLLDSQNSSKKVTNKAVFRNTTRCFKLTQEEARLLDKVALAEGVPRSEWILVIRHWPRFLVSACFW
jgi:hypothetical protein